MLKIFVYLNLCITYNEGGRYDAATGVFTCSESGVFLFSVTLVCDIREGSLFLLASTTVKLNIITTNDPKSSGSNLILFV